MNPTLEVNPTPAAFDNETFVDNLDERIRRRTVLSEEHLARENPGAVRKSLAKMGLSLANGMDRMSNVSGDSTTQGMLAGAGGAVKGAILGTFGFWGMVLVFGGGLLLMPVYLACAGLGALAVGVSEGLEAYKEAQQNSPKIEGFKDANAMATRFGAIPPPIELLPPGGLPPQELEKPKLSGLMESATPSVKQGGFVNFVEQSRAQQNVTQR